MKKFIFGVIVMLFICTCSWTMDIRQKQTPRAPKLYIIDEESLKFLAGQKSAVQRTRYQESCDAVFAANQTEPMSPEVMTFITRLKEVGYTGADESDSTDGLRWSL